MKNKKGIIWTSLALLVLAIIIGTIFKFDLLKSISLASVQKYISSYGPFAAVAYVLLFVLRTFLIFFPSTVMIFLGGSLFGEIQGFILSMVSIFLSASLAFCLSRFAGKDFINKISKKRVRQLDKKAEEHGFKVMFIMRLSIIFPFDLMNYAAGLSKMRYVDFILGTMLGIAPEIFSLNYISSNIENPLSLKFQIAMVLFIITVALPFFFNRKRRKPGIKDEKSSSLN